MRMFAKSHRNLIIATRFKLQNLHTFISKADCYATLNYKFVISVCLQNYIEIFIAARFKL